MIYNLIDQGDELVLALRGKFTHADYGDFLALSSQLTLVGKSRFIFDLSELDFIDSGGIGMMVMAADIGQQHNIQVTLRGGHGHVRTVIDNSHLSEIFIVE